MRFHVGCGMEAATLHSGEDDIPVRVALPRLCLPSGLAVGAGLLAFACLAPILSDEVMTGPILVALFGTVLLAGILWGALPAAITGAMGLVGYWSVFGGLGNGLAFPTLATIVELLSLALLLTMQITLVELMVAARRSVAVERLAREHEVTDGRLALAELQHRVANTMQFVASLLSLQADRVPQAEAQEALNDAAERLGAMANVHRRLHDAAIKQEGFEDLLREVAEGLLTARGYTVGQVGIVLHVRVAGGERLAGLATLNALALIVAEAVTNAAKHAFPRRDRGTLSIAIGIQGDDLVLSISDDGPGPPAELPEGSLGLAVMQTMAQRLGGHFTLSASEAGGARVTVSIPASHGDDDAVVAAGSWHEAP